MKVAKRDVLIVEDQILFQSFLYSALGRVIDETVNIERTNSGNNAIKLLAKKNNFALIFLDIKMSDGDGISVLRYMANKNLNNLPVYIVSSLDVEFINYVMDATRELDVRVAGFIPKGAPNSVYSRIENLKDDINSYIRNFDIADTTNE